VAFLLSALTFVLICMVPCKFKCADPGKTIPTPEQCQTSDHGCLINGASSYCSASVFSCSLSYGYTIQWSGRSSWHGLCGQDCEQDRASRGGCRFSAHSLLLTLQWRKFACFVLLLWSQGKQSLGKGQAGEPRLAA